MAGAADGFVFAFPAVVFKIGFHRLLSCGVRLGQVVNHPDAPVTAGADDAGGIQIHRGDFVASDGHPHRVGRTDKDNHPKKQKSFHTFREEMFQGSTVGKKLLVISVQEKSPALSGAVF